MPEGVSTRVAEALDEWLVDDAVVLTYFALPDEVDPGPPTARRRLLIPRTAQGLSLVIHPIDVPLTVGSFGIREPREDAEVWEGPIDVALVPGLAFGRDGSRLGRGAGYYDRFLAERPIAVRIGITWGDRFVDAVPADRHDVAMTHVATEAGVVPVGT